MGRGTRVLILGVNLQEWYQLGRVYGDMHGMELHRTVVHPVRAYSSVS
jgi:hypothetical protein